MKELFTQWGRNLDSEHVLQEYPRPIMMRETHYEILNGWWDMPLHRIRRNQSNMMEKY